MVKKRRDGWASLKPNHFCFFSAAPWATACLQRLPPRSAFLGPELPPPLPLQTGAAWPEAQQSAAPFTGDSWGTAGPRSTQPHQLHPPCPTMTPALCPTPAPGQPPTSSPSWPRNSLAGRCMPHVTYDIGRHRSRLWPEEQQFLTLYSSWLGVVDQKQSSQRLENTPI